MMKVNLKDVYFNDLIIQSAKNILRFHWKTKFHQFLVMAFGLGPASRLFTKLLRPMIAFLRRISGNQDNDLSRLSNSAVIVILDYQMSSYYGFKYVFDVIRSILS